MLLGIMGGIEGARWQREDQLHITLHFIGEVDRRTADTIADILGNIRGSAFAGAVSSVGYFEKKGKVHSLWAGVTPAEPLAALHTKLDRALVSLGLPAEQRAYRPHITLARMARPVDAVASFVSQFGGLVSAPFRMTEFGLFESLQTAEGSVYRCIEAYPLASASKPL